MIFVEEHDDVVNPLGAKGLGEIGVVGVAAAIANAVFHATGMRVRDLPITLDKLLLTGCDASRNDHSRPGSTRENRLNVLRGPWQSMPPACTPR